VRTTSCLSQAGLVGQAHLTFLYVLNGKALSASSGKAGNKRPTALQLDNLEQIEKCGGLSSLSMRKMSSLSSLSKGECPSLYMTIKL
jgi:hypothetical protein